MSIIPIHNDIFCLCNELYVYNLLYNSIYLSKMYHIFPAVFVFSKILHLYSTTNIYISTDNSSIIQTILQLWISIIRNIKCVLL